MNRNYYFVVFIALIFAVISCAREWKDPNTSIPAQSVSIADLIAHRQAYDSAGVSLIGKIWNLEVGTVPGNNKDAPEEKYTTFLLADTAGTSVDIYVPGEVDVQEGNTVRVIGVFRLEFQHTGDYFLNTVDAVRIEDWKPGLVYWIKELEFD